MITEKIYDNIYAYKPNDTLQYFIILPMYFIFFILCCLGLSISLFFLIGVTITAAAWVWALTSLIRYKLTPDFILTQKDEYLIIYPDTQNIVIPLQNIISIRKKNFIGKHRVLNYGKIIINAKDITYRLIVDDVNIIFSRLQNNLMIAKS